MAKRIILTRKAPTPAPTPVTLKRPGFPKGGRLIVSQPSTHYVRVPLGTTGKVIETFGNYVGVKLDGDTRNSYIFWRSEVKPIPADAPATPIPAVRFKRKGKAKEAC